MTSCYYNVPISVYICVLQSVQEGYGVLVLNTNRNEVIVDGKKTPIRVSYPRKLNVCT